LILNPINVEFIILEIEIWSNFGDFGDFSNDMFLHWTIFKALFLIILDVIQMNNNMAIPVGPFLLVIETQSVHEFVGNNRLMQARPLGLYSSARIKIHVLLPSLAISEISDIGNAPTGGIVFDVDEKVVS